MFLRARLLGVILVSSLAACGGGGGGDVADGSGPDSGGDGGSSYPHTLLPMSAQVTAVGSGSCAEVYGAGFALTPGQVVQGFDSSERPAKGQVLKDTAWGTCLVRVTDHAREAPIDFARNDYSRRQAFNADSSRLVVYAHDGSWHIYNASSFAWEKALDGPAGDAEVQWHPTDPDLLYYLPTNGGLTVLEHRVSTNSSRVVGDLRGRLPWTDVDRLWTKSEGSPSADARYWAFMAETQGFGFRGIVVWDRVDDKVVGKLSLSDRPDHLSMSARGDHVVASWLDRTVAYDRTLSTSRQVHSSTEHSDLALDANGDDVYVSVDYQSENGVIFMVNLRTGQRTDIMPTYFDGTATALHISGKAFSRPGWVLVSTYGDKTDRPPGGQQWLHRKLFALQLSATPKILNLTTTRTIDGDYWTEPQASVNRDFTRVVWTSNWNRLGNEIDTQGLHTDVDTYMLMLPADAIR